MVAPHAASFQQAIDHISREYNSPVRQSRVKNYLQSLRLNSLRAKGTEISEALASIYKTILRLSPQCPMSHPGDAHKIEFLRAAVVACEWAREPLSRAASHQLTYQQLYGELESALQLYKEAKLEMLLEKATNSNIPTEDGIAEISYVGQPRLRSGYAKYKRTKDRSGAQAQGCFNCEAKDHYARECPRPLNLARAAARKLDYLNSKKKVNAVHSVLADVCQQFDHEFTEESDASILMSMLSGASRDAMNDRGSEGERNVEDTLVLELTIELSTPHDEKFLRACIDSGAQMTIIGIDQAKAYCKEHGGIIIKGESKQTYRFGNKKYDNIGTINIRMPLMESHVTDIDADVVDVNVPFLLGLNNLTKLKILLDVGKDRISSANLNWEMPVIRKHGHLYIAWPKCVMFTVRELKKVHRHLFHSQPDRIYQLLRRANPNGTTADDLKTWKPSQEVVTYVNALKAHQADSGLLCRPPTVLSTGVYAST